MDDVFEIIALQGEFFVSFFPNTAGYRCLISTYNLS